MALGASCEPQFQGRTPCAGSRLRREMLEALASPLFVLASIVGVRGEGGTNFDHVISVNADGFVQSLSGDAELLAPVVDVGGDLRVDFVGAAGSVLYVL